MSQQSRTVHLVAQAEKSESRHLPLVGLLIDTRAEQTASLEAFDLVALFIDGVLVILDGSKALRSAVDHTFGRAACVQRCQVHKTRRD